jgi:outer membrane biosynthesis protein TonB
MKKIALAVLAAHFMLLILGSYTYNRPKRIRPIAVRTITIPVEPPPPSKPAPAPKATPKPSPKQPPAPKSAPPPPKKSEPPPPPPKKKSELTIPSQLKKSTPQTPKELPEDVNFKEILVAILQNALELPEYGEVKAKIEVNPQGRVVKVEILETKNQKNGEFLKNQLPELSLPCLNEMQSFTIVFKNAEVP